MKMTPEQYRKLQKESSKKLNKLMGNRTENKYKAKSQYYKGEFYHSTGECHYAQQLDMRVKANDIKSWRRQVKLDLRVNGKHITNYFMDFEITHNDGRIYDSVKP